MMTFNPNQMLAFQEHTWRLVIERLAEATSKEFPVARETLGSDGFTRFVMENANAAYDVYGITDEDDIAEYLCICARLGSHFPDDFSVRWAGELLRNPDLPLVREMIQYLDTNVRAYTWDTFLPEGSLMPFGAYRSYLAKLEHATMVSGSNTIRMLEKIWPEKAEVLAFADLREFVAETTALADGYGIAEDAERQRYVTMAFVFGMRFDIDPFYPWAGAVLRDPPANGAATVEALEQAARVQVLEPWLAWADEQG